MGRAVEHPAQEGGDGTSSRSQGAPLGDGQTRLFPKNRLSPIGKRNPGLKLLQRLSELS